MIRFEDLLDRVRSYNPDADLELLRRAYVFSALEHKGQVRHSGEPYLVHPLEVADILAGMKLDAVCVAAGLLHDVVEDTLTTPATLRERFGDPARGEFGQTLPMARVIVVGAGVVGLSCARAAARGGHHVAVFARDLPLETTSASRPRSGTPTGPSRRTGWRRGRPRRTSLERLAADERHRRRQGARDRAVPRAGRPTRGGPPPCPA